MTETKDGKRKKGKNLTDITRGGEEAEKGESLEIHIRKRHKVHIG